MQEIKKTVFIHLTPRASFTGIRGEIKDVKGQIYLKAYVTAPPEDGKANMLLTELLSQHFNIAKSRIRIVSGYKSRYKSFEIF